MPLWYRAAHVRRWTVLRVLHMQGLSLFSVQLCALDGTMALMIQWQWSISILEGKKRAPLTQVMITNCSFSPSWCSYYHKELHSHLFINSSSFFFLSLKLGAQCSCFDRDNWKWNVAESTQLEWCRTHKFSVFRPLQRDRWEKKEIILKAQVNFKRVPSQIDGDKRGGHAETIY